jgi:hypothetical protein
MTAQASSADCLDASSERASGGESSKYPCLSSQRIAWRAVRARIASSSAAVGLSTGWNTTLSSVSRAKTPSRTTR